MPLCLACTVPGIALVQEISGLHYSFWELSIPWFAVSCLTQHVCHCHQWHVPDNLSCLRISQLLTLINNCDSLSHWSTFIMCSICSLIPWEYMNISSRYVYNPSEKFSEYSSHQLLECRGCIAVPHLHYSALKVLNIVENLILQTSSGLMCVCS